MKIKVAVLEKDKNYLQRLTAVFLANYSDKIEIRSFTTLENAMHSLDADRINVFLANDTFDIDFNAVPARCGFAYFVDAADIESLNDRRAICKFQKVELIYRQILGLFSETAGSVAGMKLGDDECKLIAFASPCGGVGCSVMAAACARHIAMKGEKVLYLNLERFGSSDLFFSAEGQFDMSDVIFALKSKKANLAMKMESCVKRDACGVHFYSQPKIALDMHELDMNDVSRLISAAKLSGVYTCVVLDMDFGIDKETMKVLHQMHDIVWVGDGSEISNFKISRAFEALSVLNQSAETSVLSKLLLIYNRFSSKSSRMIENPDLRNIGGAPRFEHATTAQILERLAPMDMFDKIN